MKILGFKLSSLLYYGTSLALGLVLYKYWIHPQLPLLAEVYGEGAVILVRVALILGVLAFVLGPLIKGRISDGT